MNNNHHGHLIHHHNQNHQIKQTDPFKPVKPTDYVPLSFSRTGPAPIFQPQNATWTTAAAPRALFSSRPLGSAPAQTQGKVKPSSLQSFIDLTSKDEPGPGTGAAGSVTRDPFGDGYGIEAYSYVDAGKATENIKALLEGAFEEEEDRPRRSKKKADTKVDTQVDDLAAKLQAVGVSDEGGQGQDEEEEEEEEEEGIVEGLKARLLPHQIDGVNWMKDKESGQKKTRGVLPKGGILADDMGLGKTIQTIALLLSNPRPPKTEVEDKNLKNKFSPDTGKGTLVVAPLALIKQWESEVEEKVERTHRLKTLVYHGPARAKYATDLASFDVVISTYGTLSSEHADSGKVGKGGSGLFSQRWYRIILDEAHTIKNRNAKATQAACALDAEYRWCLTGTPMMNNLDELQSLIKFLRIKPYNDLAAWRDQITRPLNNGRGGLAIRRLQVYLKAFMKRRTKDVLRQDGLHGKKEGKDGKEGEQEEDTSEEAGGSKGSGGGGGGFHITKRDVVKVPVEFSPAEREFYSRLEARTDRSLERMMDDKLNYASALVLLLRLRQACNHIDLVRGDLAKDEVAADGQHKDKEKEKGKGDDVDGIADLMDGLSVGHRLCDVCQTELSNEAARSNRCAACDADLAAAVPTEEGEEKKKIMKKGRKEKEPSRQRRQRNKRVVVDSDDEDDEEDSAADTEADEADEDSAGDTDGDDDDDDYDNSEAEAGPPPGSSSTKIRELMRIVTAEAPTSKFIVFSFFTSMLDRLTPHLQRAGLGFARYDGAMRNDAREAALDRLRRDPSTRVLLCSLRAGALGLNLTAASRVVVLEPFWNPFVEEQAIDRVHRLGQTANVRVYRLLVTGTVEERIVALQEQKRQLVDAAITGRTATAAGAAGKLTMRDMLALFGREAEAEERDRGGLSQFGVRTRLLDGSKSLAPGGAGEQEDSKAGGRSNRGSPPVMERERRDRVDEGSVFGRRW